jgi:hypothetical protein
MIKILKPNSGNGGEPLMTAENVDAALEQVVERVTENEPELMALAEDLRFIKDPAKGEHGLESGYVLVED